jgi:hypothetical protein
LVVQQQHHLPVQLCAIVAPAALQQGVAQIPVVKAALTQHQQL